jgi:hypothetical protein
MVFKYLAKIVANHEYAKAERHFHFGISRISQRPQSSHEFAQAANYYSNVLNRKADADPKHDLSRHLAYLLAGRHLELLSLEKRDAEFQALRFSILTGHPLLPPTLQKSESESFFGKYARSLFFAGFLPNRDQHASLTDNGLPELEAIVSNQMHLLKNAILCASNPYLPAVSPQSLSHPYTAEDMHALDHILVRFTDPKSRQYMNQIIDDLKPSVGKIIAESELNLELFQRLSVK